MRECACVAARALRVWREQERASERERERERAIAINSPDRNVKKFNVLYNTKLM
jgi:hypothetical protein